MIPENESKQGIPYVTVMLMASVALLFWIFPQPSTAIHDYRLFWVGAGLAAFFELTSPSLPVFGTFSAAGAVYTFLLLTLGAQAAILAALAATGIQTLLRGRGPWLLRIFSPFQRYFSIGVAALLLPLLAIPNFPGMEAFNAFLAAAIYFLADALTEGAAVAFVLPNESQKAWFRSRTGNLFPSFAIPLLGGIGTLFYPGNLLAVGLLTLTVFLLQFVMKSFAPNEVVKDTASTFMEELESAKQQKRIAEKQCEILRNQINEKTFELSILSEFARSLGSKLTLDHAFEVILGIFEKLFHYQSCIIFFKESVDGAVYLRSKRAKSPYQEECEKIQVLLGETIVGICAQNAQPCLVDSWKYTEYPLLLENERSEIAVPLIAGQQVRGVIYVGSLEEGVLTESDLQFIANIAYQVSIVLLYAESYEHTMELATKDGLTDLYTHRYFQECLSEEILRSERYHQPLSLILLDLDNFKTYNDQKGHPEGDKLLKLTGQILREMTRGNDVVCRYGGDEFAVLLLETTKETALETAERICEALERRLNVDSEINITASIGVASFPEDASNKADLFLEADKALYEGKRGGRNQVVAARKNE